MDRERLGRLVRDIFVAWAREQPFHKPSWLVPWDELEPDPATGADQREVDIRIGEAVAAAERERIARRLADRWPGTSAEAIADLIRQEG